MEFSEARALITVDAARRKGKTAEVKPAVDDFLPDVPSIATVIVVENAGAPVDMQEGRDLWYHEAIAAADAECPAEPFDAEHPCTSSTPRAPRLSPRASSIPRAAT